MEWKYFTLSLLIHIGVFLGFNFYTFPVTNNDKKIEKNITISLVSSVGEIDQQITSNTKSSKYSPPTKDKTLIRKTEKEERAITETFKKVKKTKTIDIKKEKKHNSTDVITNNNSITHNKKNKEDIDHVIKKTQGENFKDPNLVEIGEGKYAIKNQGINGITYSISNKVKPRYPEVFLKIGLKENTTVKVKFLVDEKGVIKDIIFLSKNKKEFQNETLKAIRQWEFQPIIYKNKAISCYFYIEFNFYY